MAAPGKLHDELCPEGAIRGGKLDRAKCAHCLQRPCLFGRGNSHTDLQWSSEELPLPAVQEEILGARRLFFDGGGVTFTGGEPTLQFQALQALLGWCRENSIHTALETNGFHPRLPELFPLIGHLMIDLKHWDEERHCAFTGGALAQTVANIGKAAERENGLHIRIPLVGGFNASDDDIEGFLKFFDGLDKRRFTVELLPYHEYGKDKWARCGLEYRMKDGHVPQEVVERFWQALQERGIRTVHT